MKKFLLLFSVFLFFFFSPKAQLIDSMLRIYADEIPDQKIHVHFDKDLYRAGETIWLKSYFFSGFNLSSTSKNFYAELVNDKGNIVQRKIYPIMESSAVGSFDLPDSLPAGSLLFRGYTTWMLNFDSSFIFQKYLAVVDKAGVADKGPAVQSKNISLQFFPEGGNLVNSLESVVAFKANDEYGIPAFVKGNIVNSKGETITTFSALHDGMGKFSLSPVDGETYRAMWTDAAGKQQTTTLPVAKEQGFVLKISSVGDKKVFLLNRSETVPEEWKKVTVVAMLGQERVYRARATLVDTRVTSGAIPVKDLPSGILTVTIFSESWEPIAERIVMVNNNNYNFNAQVNTPELNTAFRAKNTFEVQVEDTLLSNMSLSVTDAAVGRQTFADNIYSRILLTGDIKGYVHNPSYYFVNNSDSLINKLDLVLLTNGWRRYNWSLLAKGRKPTIKYQADNYLGIEARVFGVTTASPLRGDEQLLIFLEGKDSLKQFIQMPKVGVDKFAVPNLVFYDTTTLYYQFAKDKKAEKEMSLGFNNNLFKGVRTVNLVNRPLSLQIDTSVLARTKFLADKLRQNGSNFNTNGNVLETVTVKARVKTRAEELEDKYASGLFKGDNGYSFDLTENTTTAFPDILQYLQGRVAGLQINGTGPSATISWRGSATSLFLNEIPTDASQISTVSVSDIAYVKVMRPPFYGATGGGAGGAIAVYTKKGGDVKPEPNKGLNKATVVGYSSVKQFYSPNYKDLSNSSEVSADYRSTLYWNPMVLTDSSRKKVRFEFYNNDVTKAFRVVLEGVNEIGKMVRIEKVIQQTR